MTTQPPFSEPMTAVTATAGRDCGAKTRGGGACRRPAGWGTGHAGVGRCKLHGGATPNHQKSAEDQQARALLGTLGVVADPSSLPVPIVHAELELSAAKQLAAVAWLEQQVGQLPTNRVDTSPWPGMLRDARRDCDRLLVELARLGLDARRVQLEERQVDTMVLLVERLVRRLGLDPLDIGTREVVHEELAAIEAGEAA